MERLAYPDVWATVRSHVVAIGLTAVAMQVGTGGAQTADYYLQRGLKGYAFQDYHQSPQILEAAKGRTPAEDLGHIRSVLKPAVIDLANALGVSRQAVYDWQNGKAIAAENASRLAELAGAADIFSAAGITTSPQLLRRPIMAGKTLFDIARDCQPLEEAAHRLVQIVEREKEQRARIALRMKGRAKPVAPSDDYGEPASVETG